MNMLHAAPQAPRSASFQFSFCWSSPESTKFGITFAAGRFGIRSKKKHEWIDCVFAYEGPLFKSIHVCSVYIIFVLGPDVLSTVTMHISINITCFASHSTHCRFTNRRWCYHPFQCQVSTNSSIPSSPRWQTLSPSRWDKWRLGSQISKLIKLDGTTDGNQEITAVPFQLSDMLKLAVGTGDLGICPCQIQTPLPSESNFLNNRGMSPQSGRRKNCMLLGLYSPVRSTAMVGWNWTRKHGWQNVGIFRESQKRYHSS